MADWETIADYVRSNWKVAEDTGTRLGLLFDMGDGRSQIIYLEKGGNRQGEGWIHFSSAVGRLGSVDIEKAASRAGTYLCGGVVVEGSYVTIRHSAPLENIDTNELERPLSVVLDMADAIEKDLSGGSDDF